MTDKPPYEPELSGQENLQNKRCMFCEKNIRQLTPTDNIRETYFTHLSKSVLLKSI